MKSQQVITMFAFLLEIIAVVVSTFIIGILLQYIFYAIMNRPQHKSL